jgi:hypothetical protein
MAAKVANNLVMIDSTGVFADDSGVPFNRVMFGQAEVAVSGSTTGTANRAHTLANDGSDYTLTLPSAASANWLGVRVAQRGTSSFWTLDAGAGVSIDGRSTTLNGAINSAVTSLVVASSTGFPASPTPFFVQIASEILKVTAISGTTWTVVRGQCGTTAASQSNGAAITLNRTRILWSGESAILRSDGTNWFKVGGNTIPMTGKIARTTSQAYTAGVTANVAYGTVSSDPTGRMADVANNRLIPFRPGWYTCSASFPWASSAVSGTRAIGALAVGGVTIAVSEADDSNVYATYLSQATALIGSGTGQATTGFGLVIAADASLRGDTRPAELWITEIPQW